jgi:hypothetical protein
MNTFPPIIKMRTRIVLFAFFMVLFVSASSAQSAIITSGGNASGSGGTVSYTIGQVGYSSYSGNGGTVNLGVQQPYEISVITAIENTGNISLEFVVYPNPVTDYLTLKITGELPAQCNAFLYDINGSLLLNKKVEINETLISLEKLIPGTYFLKISDNKKR